MNRFFQISIAALLISCSPKEKTAQEVIDQVIAAHGCELLENRTITFDFRDKAYSLLKSGGLSIYTRSFSDSAGYVLDSLINSSDFTRHINDTTVTLTDEWKGKYASSVNSVLYFFQLPCLLNDPAVIKKMAGTATIKGSTYFQVEVRFKVEGGGEDFEDVYMYWINQETYTMDYLAYNYQVDGGGTRFREAINRRVFEGLIVQDYINYKSEEKFPLLSSLPTLLEKGELTELSRILNTSVSID